MRPDFIHAVDSIIIIYFNFISVTELLRFRLPSSSCGFIGVRAEDALEAISVKAGERFSFEKQSEKTQSAIKRVLCSQMELMFYFFPLCSGDVQKGSYTHLVVTFVRVPMAHS